MNEAFSKWADEMTAIGTERGAMWTAWRACEEHYAEILGHAADIERIYKMSAGEILRRLQFYGANQPAEPPKLTRAGVLALADNEEGLERLRKLVVEICGAERIFRMGEGDCWRFPNGQWLRISEFKPDENPAHNRMVIEAMREKGFVRCQCIESSTMASTCFKIAKYQDGEDGMMAPDGIGFKGCPPDCVYGPADDPMATCRAAVLAVRGL